MLSNRESINLRWTSRPSRRFPPLANEFTKKRIDDRAIRALISSSRAGAFVISSSWFNACSGCTVAANHGFGMVERCWLSPVCGIRTFSRKRSMRGLPQHIEFLRNLEHRLQFFDDRQTHSLPVSREELEVLARKMPKAELGRLPSADKLLHQLECTPRRSAGNLRSCHPLATTDVLHVSCPSSGASRQ